jgi:hypothetical protein
MGAVGKFLLDKLIKYGIEILVKMILKWVEQQEAEKPTTAQTTSEPKPPDSGWNDKNRQERLFDPKKMMK